LYENDYIKENGRWRILSLQYRPQWHAAYDRGWDKTPADWLPFFKGPKYPEMPNGPDIIEEAGPDSLWLWPDSLTFFKNVELTGSTRVAIPLS